MASVPLTAESPATNPAARLLLRVEAVFDRAFGAAWNPFYRLGALTIYFFWLTLISGIYVFVFFDTSVVGAYQSVEYLTHQQWYLGGVMRSLHRYTSDAAVVTLILHVLREFVLGRYRGPRWFSWFTGVPLLWMVFPLGITGYWLVWDQLAVYVAVGSAELLDWLPIFTDPMARNFLTTANVSDRFFTLLAFIHLIGLPIFLVFGIWFHVLRISRPSVNPPSGLAVGSLLAMLVLSLAFPALSHAPADLAHIPESYALDWFYLPAYVLQDYSSPGLVWGVLFGGSLLLSLMPWLPRRKPAPTVAVSLDNCNGCGRCATDCPYGAITMRPRSDGLKHTMEAVVDADICTGCGICVGACPSSTPLRSIQELISGIDLPELPVGALRSKVQTDIAGLRAGPKVLVIGCRHGAPVDTLQDTATATVSLPCIGNLHPDFIDYALRRAGADGVLITGCPPGSGRHRFGPGWTGERIAGQREPHLRSRVDRQRVQLHWASPVQGAQLAKQLAAFRSRLAARSEGTNHA